MGLKLTILDTGPKTYAEELARKEVWNRVHGVSNTVFANNGTTEPSINGSYYPKTVKGPTEIEAGTEAIYEITEFALYKNKEENEEDLAKDKKQFKWVLYIDGVEIKNNLLKYITLRGFEKKEISESQTDFMEIADAQKRTDAILQYGITYFKVEGEKRNEKTKITLKFSKWLDTHKIHIEAYRNKPDLNPKKPYVATTLVKAKPEIIKGFWVNENKENITNKIIGYKETVFMCLKTLGMKDKNLNIELWEDDYGFGDEQIQTENTAFEITNRYTYKKSELPEKSDDDYQKQRGGAEGDQLELYFKLPFEKETLGFKDGFARSLKLTTKEKLTETYFAIEKKREQIQDSTLPEPEQTPAIHTVRPNPRETITDVATQYGLNAQELANLNKVTLTKNLTYGTSVQLKTQAQIDADKKAKADRAKKQETAKTEPYYQRIDTASLGSEVWLVVESANLQGKKCTIEVFDNEELLEDSDDTAITILKDNAEVTKLENLKFDDEGKAKVKIKLRKKSDEDYKKQKDKFKDDKVAKLYLKVSYKGEDKKTHKVEFLDGEEFEIGKIGVLEEMKELVDKHIKYSQVGVRDKLSEEGLKALDCSETVAIYLHKLGVMPKYKAIYTGVMATEKDFRKTIGTNNIELVSGSDKKNFKPQRGDIFVWRDGDGHTGIVYDYDAVNDVVVILEAIGSKAVGESKQVKNGGHSGTGCTRTAKYGRLDGALYGHRGWKGYFRPINYTEKL